MKLPIKKQYFDKIVSGEKSIELRDAHITFICEETKQQCYKKVTTVEIIPKPDGYDEVLEDDFIIAFHLERSFPKPAKATPEEDLKEFM